MFSQLKITSVSPSVNCNNSKAANTTNYDYAKASAYPHLHGSLQFKNGKKVTTSNDWIKRRKEIVEDFDREIYGRTPANTPESKLRSSK
jgi:hypothetical protein